VKRRALLQWMAAGTGLRSLSARDTAELGREVHRMARLDDRPGALDPQQTRTVAAAAETILPAGDGPGATEAGVAAFVDRMMADWYPPAERDAFLAGLLDLDARARTRAGRAFTDCGEADQIAVVTALDDELAALRARPGAASPDQHWFAILKYLTIWGYCTSAAGAQHLGLDAMPLRYDGNAPYQPRAGR